mmetsp:Transcript_107490/g.213453  ORF Transcript_107490/g.213453 Transcript_107490/m.213453 type:complete len:486 (-) Transcript_107490:168-1625(-)
MGWIALSIFDLNETSDCLGGDGPFYRLVEYDSRLCSMIGIILVAVPMNLKIVYHYAINLPPHPKFLMLMRYRIITNIHILAGSIEIIAGIVMFFVNSPVHWVQVQAGASIVHAVSAMGLIRLLFGMKLFMNIIYGTGVIMKAVLAVNVLLHPDCYLRAMALTAFHTVYAWVRVIFVFLRTAKIMKETRYTTSVILASFVVLPVVDRLANLINISLICLGGLYITFCADEETRVNYLTEFSRDITTFRHYAATFKKGRQTACHHVRLQRSDETDRHRTYESLNPVAEDGNGETEDFNPETFDQSKEFRARSIFDTIAKGRQRINPGELAAVLCSFGMPTSDVHAVMDTYTNSGSISFDTFLVNMKPLWEYMYSELKRDDGDVCPSEEFKNVAHTNFARMSLAYRAHLDGEDPVFTSSSSGKFAPRSPRDGCKGLRSTNSGHHAPDDDASAHSPRAISPRATTTNQVRRSSIQDRRTMCLGLGERVR